MQTSKSATEPAADVGRGSILDSFKEIWGELPRLISDRIELLSLELQRAGLALLHIVTLGIAISILAITAWLMLCALFVVGLFLLGLHWMAALLIGLVVQLILAAWAIHRAKKLLSFLQLPATRRHLTVSPNSFTNSPAPARSGTEATSHDTTTST